MTRILAILLAIIAAEVAWSQVTTNPVGGQTTILPSLVIEGALQAGSLTLANPLPTGSGGTGDIGAAWSAYTPSISCGTGTFTVNSAKSKTLGKTTFLEIDFTVTAVGTCNSNNLTFNIPITTNSAGGLAGQVANNAVGGGVLCGIAGGAASVESCKRTDNTFILNDRVVLSGVLENQ